MRKILSIVLVMTMLFSLAPMSFGADSEEKVAADRLNQLGLFAGTGTNPDGTPIYSLEGIPTRSQAITMLVKLLGKEAEAVNGTWDIPFTDVPNWAKPFVGYAYANGLTAGTSPTTFGGNDTVTAAQYLTFVLKALGYDASADFSWRNPWDLSDKIGLTDGRYNATTNNFLRGDIALISESALDLELKGTETPLVTIIQENLAKAEQEKTEEEPVVEPEEPEVVEPEEEIVGPIVRDDLPIVYVNGKAMGDYETFYFRAYEGKVGTTVKLDLEQFGERLIIDSAESSNKSVCTVKVNKDGSVTLKTVGKGHASLTFVWISGGFTKVLEDGTEAYITQYTRTNFEWYGHSGDGYVVPGISLRAYGGYYSNGENFGIAFGPYNVFEVLHDGALIKNYTVEGLDGLEYKIQADGTLFIRHDRNKGNYPLKITHDGVSSSYILFIDKW